jgi:excisionase family DNA binding protein
MSEINQPSRRLPKLAYTITEVMEVIGVRRTKLYDEINCGNLKSRKLGSKTLILIADLEEYLANLPSTK